MPLLPRRTPQPVVDQDFLNACSTPKAIQDDYKRAWDYYTGAHGTIMADRSRRYLQRSGLLFAENFCEPVVDVMAERLTVTGWSLEDKSQGDSSRSESEQLEQLGKWLDSVAQRNRLDAKQRTLHTTGLIKGDAYLVVDFDNIRRIPRFTFNRPDMVKPCYLADEPDVLEYVSKRWPSNTKGPQNPGGRPIVRLNVYYPDRVEKFFKVTADGAGEQGGAWETWQDEGDNGWPVAWVDADGSPLGIPVFHFRHKPLGEIYGRSELRSVIPQQDELNKQIIDLNDILDYQAWPQRWVSGVGGATSLKPAPGSYLKLGGADARAGQFDAADLDQVVAAVDATISRIARRSRTPMHLLVGGTTPSGEALKTAEAGLIAKIEASQVDFGQSWEDVALMALRLGRLQGVLPVQPPGDLGELVAQTQWDSALTRNELAEAQRIQILVTEGLISKRTATAELGYDPDQEEQNRLLEEQALNEAAGAMLDRGSASDYQSSPAVSTPHITLQLPPAQRVNRTIALPSGRTATVTEN